MVKVWKCFFRMKESGFGDDNLMWVWDERVESMIMPRLWTSGEGEMEEPSKVRSRSPVFLSSAL